MKPPSALQVVEEARIQASPERVFDALTTPDELTAWWRIPGQYETLVAEVDLRIGGRYRLSGTSVRGKSFSVTGEYRVVDRPNRLAYTWVPDWEDGARGSLVDIRLEADGTGTMVRLVHSAFLTASARDSHSQGWPAVLNALLNHVETVTDSHQPINRRSR